MKLGVQMFPLFGSEDSNKSCRSPCIGGGITGEKGRLSGALREVGGVEVVVSKASKGESTLPVLFGVDPGDIA